MKLLILTCLIFLGVTETLKSGKYICEITQELENIQKKNAKNIEHCLVAKVRGMSDLKEWPNILHIYVKHYKKYGTGVQALGYLMAHEDIRFLYYDLKPVDIIEAMLCKRNNRNLRRPFIVGSRMEFLIEDFIA